MQENERSEAVAKRLKALRLEQGFNKAEFAREAGISKQAYGAFENAQRALSLEGAQKLHHRFGVSLDHLFLGK